MTLRVMLADDQALLRGTFRLLIDAEPDMEVAAEAGTGRQAELARTELPDVVVMDIRMPGQAYRRLDDLTPREREIMALAATGLSNDDIAEKLFITPLTAKPHVNRAMFKLGARDRAQLVVIAYETGIVRAGQASPRR